MSRAWRPVVAVIALSGLTACTSGWEDFELDPYLPTVTFSDLNVNDVDWDGVQADFVFDVENPNPVDVGMARFDYALAFEEIQWLSGDSPDGLVLKAEDASELALPVEIEFQALYEMVQAIRGQDDIGFGLDGSFGFDTPIGPLDIPYVEDGGFPAPRKPNFSLQRVKLQYIDLSGADLKIKLDVDNSHGSNLIFQNVQYDLKLAGIDVGGGFLEQLGDVEGATTKTVTLPISIDFLEVGLAAYDILQGEQVQVDVQASMDVDTPFGIVPLDLDEVGSVLLER